MGVGAGLLVSAVLLTAHFVKRGPSAYRSLTVVRSFDSAQLPGVLTEPVPWSPNTADVPARLKAMGLPGSDGTTLHIHQHLDVFVDGNQVVVPAGIGIDPNGRFIAPIHTHDSSGVIHVESPVHRSYTLGELFGVWGVRFTSRCLGAYCRGAGKVFEVFVDGRRVESNPTRLPLRSHDEIAVVVGERVAVPSAYAFPSGL